MQTNRHLAEIESYRQSTRKMTEEFDVEEILIIDLYMCENSPEPDEDGSIERRIKMIKAQSSIVEDV